jgi:uncharacterized protein
LGRPLSSLEFRTTSLFVASHFFNFCKLWHTIRSACLNSGKRIIYLHGFASSPNSRKAAFFRERFEGLGVRFETPNLEEGDFRDLTISAQIKLLDRLNPEREQISLIGSSLGGFVAASYAGERPEIEKLVLLAPAFCFQKLWAKRLGPEGIESWRQNGSLSVFHYGKGKELPVGYQLFEDATTFADYPDLSQPTLIFHGENDSVVPIQQSIIFTERHPNASLCRMQSGHELTDVLGEIWLGTRNFLLDN